MCIRDRSEAVTNAIIHGYEMGDDNISSGQAEHQAAEEKSCPQVHMNCSYIGRELYIEISDSGVGIQDVAKAMEPVSYTHLDVYKRQTLTISR